MDNKTAVSPSTAIVILAAGKSERLGQPKQLLLFREKVLLQYILDEAEATGLPVLLVLGAHYESIEDQIVAGTLTTVLRNDQWPEGMAASVRMAVNGCPPEVQQLLFCVCDQVYLTKEILLKTIDLQSITQKKIVAAAYNGAQWGVPMLIDRSLFPELLTLRGDTGAKKIALQHLNKMATFEFPLGIFDIDTPEDYKAIDQ